MWPVYVLIHEQRREAKQDKNDDEISHEDNRYTKLLIKSLLHSALIHLTAHQLHSTTTSPQQQYQVWKQKKEVKCGHPNKNIIAL